MGLDYTYEAALIKALISAGLMLPRKGSILVSIANKDKEEALPIIKGFHSLGYSFYATSGTAALIEKNGISVKQISKKLNEGHPNVIDIINDGSVAGVINTVTGGRSSLQDGFEIRRTATEKRIPCFTSLDTAKVVWKALTKSDSIYNVKTVKEYLAGPEK